MFSVFYDFHVPSARVGAVAKQKLSSMSGRAVSARGEVKSGVIISLVSTYFMSSLTHIS
jgi:hypothetical protein